MATQPPVDEMPEIIKHNTSEFGGIQFRVLEPEELAQRFCCARWCGSPGYSQLAAADGKDMQTYYRVICKVHAVRVSAAIAVVFGDASLADARSLADNIGIGWEQFLRDRPFVEPIAPEEFRCILCGGNMIAETVGMFSGRRWIHTCEESR